MKFRAVSSIIAPPGSIIIFPREFDASRMPAGSLELVADADTSGLTASVGEIVDANAPGPAEVPNPEAKRSEAKPGEEKVATSGRGSK